MNEEHKALIAKCIVDVDKLTTETAEKLFDFPESQDNLFSRLREAKNALQKIDLSVSFDETISRVEFDIKSISAIIYKHDKLESERIWLGRSVPIIIAVYIILIILTVLFSRPEWNYDTKIPLIGVPVSVVLWASIGSLSAILYRFYNYDMGRVREAVKWLVARPIIGVIMGSLAYLALLSGLLVFGTTSGGPNSTVAPRVELVWVIAFLGGFSDKFFETMISLALTRVSTDSHKTEETIHTVTEREELVRRR